jgi:polyvinyl alcohol dehydrogenase (cytochrome)
MSARARYQTAERAGLRAADIARLELKWAYGFAGDIIAFGAPTVVNGPLFVGSASGLVQALDTRTGCLHWRYQANGPVRSAMTVAAQGDDRTLLFSDQNGGVYGVSAANGTLRWQTRVEQHEATAELEITPLAAAFGGDEKAGAVGTPKQRDFCVATSWRKILVKDAAG